MEEVFLGFIFWGVFEKILKWVLCDGIREYFMVMVNYEMVNEY